MGSKTIIMHVSAIAAMLAANLVGPSAAVLASQIRPRQAMSDDPARCKLAADPDMFASEGISNSTGQFVSSTGTLHASMIFVDFPDAQANDSTQALYDLFIPGAPDFYRTSSFGALELDVVAPEMSFYRMPAASDSYGFERGLTAETHGLYIQDALDAVGSDVSFADIELLYIVPTTAATAISFSPTYQNTITAGDGTLILRTVTFGQDAPVTWGYKVMNHETGHAMGLPDLYPFDGTDTTRWTGGFDMMSLISGVAPDFGAWHKWKLGWLEDEQIACVASTPTDSRTFTLSALEVGEGEGSKAVVVVHNETTALVAEARTTNGVDGDVCAEGVLIYVVYTDVVSGQGPIRVFDSRPGSGGCGGDELNDAPYDDATFTSEEFGVSIIVGARDGDSWEVTVDRA